MELPIENWYRLAAAVVEGIEDPEELESWRQWAYERARRIPVDAPKAQRHPDSLWADTHGLTPARDMKRRQAGMKRK